MELEQAVDADDQVGEVEGVVFAQGMDVFGVQAGKAEARRNAQAGRRAAGADVGEVVLGVAAGAAGKRRQADLLQRVREKKGERLAAVRGHAHARGDGRGE